MKTGIVSILGLLLVLFLVMMLARNGVVGYSSTKTLAEYPYEGFESVQNAFEKRYSEAMTANPASPVPGPVPEKKEGFEPMVQALKVAGFSGLQSGAYGDEKAIGFMYNNEGSTTCKSYGYTNSKGNICLSESDIKLLTTRGGNAVGASDQIGAAAK